LTENHIIMSILIGKIIQQRRKQLKITQPHLAELAEVNVNTIYRIERNEANSTIQVLSKILNVLGMELKIEVKKIN
jgi:transcriptional regulator with XRE-family HTH domain